jgi:hypothetical protein
VSIATQQQQQLTNKVMEKQQSELQLDKSRVTLLLEINAELLREVLNVQPKLKSPEEAKNDPVFREYAIIHPGWVGGVPYCGKSDV